MSDTYFAPAKRTNSSKLAKEVKIVADSPFVSGLLESISGVFAVLNEHRQIIAVNNALLEMLGIDDPAISLGLRPGEALNCVHAFREPGGCA
jgi:PAS domain-containing protein